MLVSVGAHEIHVATQGSSGPAVVALHSSGLTSAQWRRLAKRLAPSFRVWTPDFVGYGANAPWQGPNGFELREDVQVAVEVARRAGGPVHLIGHSYGGLIALLAAASGELELASLAVYEPVAFGVLFAAGDEEGIADLRRADAEGDFFAPELEGTAAWCARFVDFWQGPGAWERIGALQQEAFQASARKMFHEVKAVIEDRTPPSAFTTLRAPTLLLSGRRSPLAARRVVEILAREIPGARAATVDAGHLGPVTHADAVNELLAAHVASASAVPLGA